MRGSVVRARMPCWPNMVVTAKGATEFAKGASKAWLANQALTTQGTLRTVERAFTAVPVRMLASPGR